MLPLPGTRCCHNAVLTLVSFFLGIFIVFLLFYFLFCTFFVFCFLYVVWVVGCRSYRCTIYIYILLCVCALGECFFFICFICLFVCLFIFVVFCVCLCVFLRISPFQLGIICLLESCVACDHENSISPIIVGNK